MNKKPKSKVSKKLFLNKIAVKKSLRHGFGVFAEKNIKKGEKIEECYFILSKGGDESLEDFYFAAKRKNAVFLGYGSIYNHSDNPNADYRININKRIATIKATSHIKKGEEILISYGEKWFKSRNLKSK